MEAWDKKTLNKQKHGASHTQMYTASSGWPNLQPNGQNGYCNHSGHVKRRRCMDLGVLTLQNEGMVSHSKVNGSKGPSKITTTQRSLHYVSQLSGGLIVQWSIVARYPPIDLGIWLQNGDFPGSSGGLVEVHHTLRCYFTDRSDH